MIKQSYKQAHISR